ncbi:MAG: NAD(P)-dependent oxidoreductase, partial [Verrucomicrobia bacterium]|nr:NAD(P)-dependent oxidoreductase [Verrucomicrobiota bacterium]
MKKRIGWIGTGVMGQSMCAHIMSAGYAVRVNNRTRHKASGLVGQGAIWCDTPAEVAQHSDVIFVMVGYPADVESVIRGADGVLQTCAQGGIVIDMTTSEPSLAVRLHTEAAAKGIHTLDAPVSGGDIGAREGALAIMVGGDKTVFDESRPMLERLGRNITHMGPPGSGQHAKMCNQILNA